MPAGRTESRFLPIVLGLISATTLGSFLLGGLWFYRQYYELPPKQDAQLASKDHYTFQYPAGWKVSRNPPREMDAVLLLRRSDPDATTLLAVRDNKTRLASEADL